MRERVRQAMLDHPGDTPTQIKAVGLSKTTFYQRRKEVLDTLSKTLKRQSLQGVVRMARPKAFSPISVEHFDNHASTDQAVLVLSQLDFDVRDMKNPFPTKEGDRNPGKMGWYAGGQRNVDIGGTRTKLQISANIQITGSNMMTDEDRAKFVATPDDANTLLKGLTPVVRNSKKPFSSGSFGYSINLRGAKVEFGGKIHSANINISMVVIGSKGMCQTAEDQDQDQDLADAA